MKSTRIVLRIFALSLLFTGALAQAATVTGTVTDKTTNKPAAGDAVVLVDVQAGMGEVAHATTDAHGHYSLNEPGSGPYLVRVTHQGAGYFIAAPRGNAHGDIPVYDVAAKVQGVFIEADVLEVESQNGQLTVTERYFVRNTSSPPLTQWSARSFQIVVPFEAVIDGAEAQRPSGLPTSIKLDPDGPKGHYAFNFPIQPDDGEKDTLFQLSYHLPYASGKFTFKAEETLPADNVAIILPKSMTFTPGSGTAFKSVPQDPGVQTFVAKNAIPGKAVEFTISGEGSIPREAQGAQAGDNGTSDTSGPGSSVAGNQPGGGIGNPINTPDPLSKYKGWILGGLALLLAAAAAFLLRKPVGLPATGAAADTGTGAYPAFGSPAAKQAALLNTLKEELFALESEKISGTIAPEEYAQVKAALETVLRRALKRQ
ncbi:MAG: carboxypeptidase-like regulatory domain-containing protein [Terracidiphilus sp.]